MKMCEINEPLVEYFKLNEPDFDLLEEEKIFKYC